MGRLIIFKAEVVLRKKYYLLLGSIFFFWSSFGSSLNYSDLEVIFRASKPPQASKHLGVWLGRCVHQADPQRLWPAFYELRTTSKDQGLTQYSQSHLWFNEQTEKYDAYTLKDISQDPQCLRWVNQEQWNAIYYENFSLVNQFKFPNRIAKRAIRLYQDGIREHIILAYFDEKSESTFPASFCFFNVRVLEGKNHE